MVGDHQELSKSILRLYRTPFSTPSFVNDVVQEMFETVAAGNTTSLPHRGVQFLLPILEPSGSRDQFFYKIEEFWGPSDHEDVTPLGIHAVLLNTWPDPYIGTNEDTKERADATQMKRATVIAGASAYILANAGPREIPVLVQNALGKARARLAGEERRAMDLLWQSSPKDPQEDLREAANIVARDYINDNLNELSGGESAAQDRLQRHARAVARSRGVDFKEPWATACSRGGTSRPGSKSRNQRAGKRHQRAVRARLVGREAPRPRGFGRSAVGRTRALLCLRDPQLSRRKKESSGDSGRGGGRVRAGSSGRSGAVFSRARTGRRCRASGAWSRNVEIGERLEPDSQKRNDVRYLVRDRNPVATGE